MGANVSAENDGNSSTSSSVIQPSKNTEDKLLKIGEYSNEDWMGKGHNAASLGFDHCSRCSTTSMIPFYFCNCFPVHSEDTFRRIKGEAYDAYEKSGSIKGPVDVLHFSVISCNWTMAVFKVKIKELTRSDDDVKEKLLFYAHHDKILLGEYEVDDNLHVSEVYISPDDQMFVVHFVENLQQDQTTWRVHVKSSLRCITFQDRCAKVMDQLSDIYCEQFDSIMVSFDPRFGYSRIACYIPSCNYHNHVRATSELFIYDLEKHKSIYKTTVLPNISHGQHRTFVSFNPEGTMISLLVNNLTTDEIVFYNSDTLERFSQVPCYFNAKDMLCKFPAYSIDNRYISVPSRRNGTTNINVYQISKSFPTLQNFCRQIIVRHMTPNEIDELPLPNQLISYAKHGPIWE